MLENLIVGIVVLVSGIAVYFTMIVGVLLAIRLGVVAIILAPVICDEFVFGLREAFRGFPREDLRRCLPLRK